MLGRLGPWPIWDMERLNKSPGHRAQRIAVASSAGVWMYRSDDLETAPRLLEGHTGHVWSVAFSPNGSLLASSSNDKTVRLWNVRTGQTITTLEGHDGSVNSVAF